MLAPQPGEALQGSVPVVVRFDIEGVQRVGLYFSYIQNPTNTWFLIYSSAEEVTEGELTQWDTSTITDGDYTLRMEVTFRDGSQSAVDIPGLRVRNYSPIETDTPSPTNTPEPGDTPAPTTTHTPTETPFPPTSTPLPTNPAELSSAQIAASMGRGLLATLVLFALVGMYLFLRSARKNRR